MEDRGLPAELAARGIHLGVWRLHRAFGWSTPEFRRFNLGDPCRHRSLREAGGGSA